MHASKLIEDVVRRKVKEMVDSSINSKTVLLNTCECPSQEAERLEQAMVFLTKASDAMVESFASILAGTSTEDTRRTYRDADTGSSSASGSGSSASKSSDESRRFDPIEMLGRGLDRFDAEAVSKGLDVAHGFVRMIEDLKRRGGRRS